MSLKLDTSHSSIEFSVRHMGLATVRGRFNKFDVQADVDERGEPVAAKVVVDTASISTGVEDRDNHLRSPDFFDVEKFPTLTFESTKIAGTPSELTITGNLTIRGVTKEIVLTGELSPAMKDPWGLQRRSLEVTGKIKRSEFGLTWNQVLEMGGVMVSDDVKLSIAAEAVAAVEATA